MLTNGEPTHYLKLSRLIVLATFYGLYFVCSTATLTTTFTNFTQHLVTDWNWSPSCLIHRQLHQRGHPESHGRRECWPPSLYTSTKTTAMNKDKCPRISHIKKLSILQFRSLAISTFWSTDRHVFWKHFSPFQTFAWCYLTKTWLI